MVNALKHVRINNIILVDLRCWLEQLDNIYFSLSANGTHKASKGDQRVPEAVSTNGLDGNNLEYLSSILVAILVQFWNNDVMDINK